MIILELALEALRNLSRHKLRSFLTALGIICGIGSVTAMVSTGEGARRAILAQIGELGIQNIIVRAVKPPEDDDARGDDSSGTLRYGITFRDADQIRETVPTIEHVLPVHDVDEWIWFRSKKLEAKIRGVTPAYFDVLKMEPVMGRVLSDRDGSDRRRVCVVRRRLLLEAGYLGDPLRLDLKIGSIFFRVVGVLPDNKLQSHQKSVLGVDDRSMEVFVPFDTVVARFGLERRKRRQGSTERTRVELHQMLCRVRSEDEVLSAAKCVKGVLEKFHEKKDYEVSVPLELLASRQETQKAINLVLTVIAGISLLVGGIGVLNIMLASITERTREIGIRRAIGATRGDITLQFLVETMTLVIIGGFLGVGVGFLGTIALEKFAGWETAVTPWAVTLSMGISCLTGIVFGIYPARRAATMDPIHALRHE